MKFNYIPEINEPFAFGYLSALGKGKYSAMGEGLYQECAVLPIEYDEDVKLFQCGRVYSGITFISGSALSYNNEVIQKKEKEYPDCAAFWEAAKQVLEPLDTGSLIRKNFNREECISVDNGTCWGGTWAGHTIPDFGGLLDHGTAGMRARIAKYRKVNPYSADFYD